MTSAQWQLIIRKWWLSFTDKLAYNRKVTFVPDDVAICISDLEKHYSVKSNRESCKSNCPYVFKFNCRFKFDRRIISNFSQKNWGRHKIQIGCIRASRCAISQFKVGHDIYSSRGSKRKRKEKLRINSWKASSLSFPTWPNSTRVL